MNLMFRRHLAAFFAVLGHALLIFDPAAASPASNWSASSHSAIRLLDAGVTGEPPSRLAGLEIMLPQGFKTYWRMPGDSGVPPVFDWSGSRNVAAVEILWPAPHRFEDQAGSSIGYSGELIFPLKITLEDPARPALLALSLNYAICEKLCIPAKGSVHLDLPSGLSGTPQSERVAVFLARTPVPAAIGPGQAPGITKAAAEPSGDAVIVEAIVPASGLAELFIEGPDPWIFGTPIPLDSRATDPGGLAVRYRVPVEGRPEQGKLDGLDLILTLTAGDRAIEARARLDGVPVKR